MKQTSFVLVAVFAAGFTLSAAADTTTPPPPPPPPPAQQEVDPEQAKKDAYDNEIICRTEDETGTRLRKTKICMTRKQWRSGEQDAQDAVSAAQRRGATSGLPGN